MLRASPRSSGGLPHERLLLAQRKAFSTRGCANGMATLRDATRSWLKSRGTLRASLLPKGDALAQRASPVRAASPTGEGIEEKI